MRGLKEYITLNESEVDNLKPTNRDELIRLINQRIKEQGPKCDLNDIDVSRVDDMSWLFYDSTFNGDISGWDVSNVQDMSEMFANSKFNGEIDKWDVRRVANMRDMFYKSPLSPLKGKAPRWYKG